MTDKTQGLEQRIQHGPLRTVGEMVAMISVPFYSTARLIKHYTKRDKTWKGMEREFEEITGQEYQEWSDSCRRSLFIVPSIAQGVLLSTTIIETISPGTIYRYL